MCEFPHSFYSAFLFEVFKYGNYHKILNLQVLNERKNYIVRREHTLNQRKNIYDTNKFPVKNRESILEFSRKNRFSRELSGKYCIQILEKFSYGRP
ncbi:hypothetical protein LEP1GSC018_0420 [Leptospira kirschneri str. 2008720114]|nr:hypothetical protein LEP1GSC018_0420 [Leptospira kirschneri str. 2008720114]